MPPNYGNRPLGPLQRNGLPVFTLEAVEVQP